MSQNIEGFGMTYEEIMEENEKKREAVMRMSKEELDKEIEARDEKRRLRIKATLDKIRRKNYEA